MSQAYPSHATPAADAPGQPDDAAEIERKLRHMYPKKLRATDIRFLGYTQIDDVLGGLEAGMGCKEIEEATGICHNHVREILRGTFLKYQGDERVPMTGKQQSTAAKIRMMKHPKQRLSAAEPIRRGKRKAKHMNTKNTFFLPTNAPAVDPKAGTAAIAAMYEDRLAELENENKRMREQLVEMHMRLMGLEG